MSLRDTILKPKPLKAIKVEEWDETIYVKKMNGTDVLYFQEAFQSANDKPNEKYKVMIDFVMLCARDDKGDLIFKETDSDLLMELPYQTVLDLSFKIMDAIGFNGKDKKKAKKK